GSNGYVERSQLKQILETVSPAKRIVVVNVDVPREWQDPNNTLIAELVAQTPNAVLADWHARADQSGDVHVKDGIHLTESGIAAYSDVINEALNQILASQGLPPNTPRGAAAQESTDQASVTAPSGAPDSAVVPAPVDPEPAAAIPVQ
ncbi:MAG: hypothetical protein KDG49_11065, partial [Geminicoccaceae bacterium]|nr:hypothetical protein [Geminicoccaceae bacterium]